MQSVSEGMEEIIVTGQATIMRDLNSGVGSSFTAEDINNTPATQRDVIRTLLRDPLAQSNGDTGNLSVAGVNPRFNGLAIDGSLQQDDFGLGSSTYATARSPINLDAIESATLVASDYDVTSSGFTGGLVNLTTKSGTNEWDGSAFYYSQTDSMIGDTYDGDRTFTPGDIDEKEYGVTLRGPILRDKLFFAFSYDEFESADTNDFSNADANDGREAGFFDILFIGITDDGREIRTVVTGDMDPGYGCTAKMIAESAACLVQDCPDLPGGFYTPAPAMGERLMQRLVDRAGFTFGVEDEE